MKLRSASPLLLWVLAACATSPTAGPAPAPTAEVREIAHMAEALADVPLGTLVVLDLDNTLIAPVGELGSDQWFYHLLATYQAEGLGEDAALAKAMALWNAVQADIAVQAVEAETPRLLAALVERTVPVLGLTARTPDVAELTAKQLRGAGLELGPRPEGWPTAAELPGLEGARLAGGVLYVGETRAKGEALVHFLAALPARPARVIFVDDKPKHVQSVRAALATAGVAVTAFRYGAADARVAAFRPEAAEAELAAWREAHR